MTATNNNHILIIDDDIKICKLLSEFLSKHGYDVSAVHNGKEMKNILEKQRFDIVLLDLMLPFEDGLSLCRKIRQQSDIPIIMVTAVDEDVERIAALEIGADYYMTKPLNLRVLLAYIKTLLRRHEQAHIEPAQQAHVYHFAGWRLDVNTRRLLSPQDVDITLASGEYHLLVAFLKHPQHVLNRDQLLNHVYKRDIEPYDRTIDILISRLRRKIGNDLIKTIRNEGYVFNEEVTQS